MGMKTFLDVLTLCAYKQTSDRFTEPKRVRSTVKTLNNTETSNYYIMFLSVKIDKLLTQKSIRIHQKILYLSSF